MTTRERARALLPFGFTERQSRFLTVAALQAGYFLRRHYTAFSDVSHGQAVTDFIDRLTARGYAERVPCRAGRGSVFHLHARPLYAALGEEHNRNRRRTSMALIARKLMLLDYVLSERDVEWSATEADKVALFRDRLGVAEATLPRRDYRAAHPAGPITTRYFVEKLPIGIDPVSLSIRFVYLVIDTTGAGFKSYLDDHAQLLTALPSWTITVVCPPHIPGLRAAESAFARFASGERRSSSEDVELVAYFRARRLIEAGELRALSVAELTRYRAARTKYADARYEARYTEWCRSEPSACPSPPVSGEQSAACRGTLLTYTLPFRYDHFGSLPGLA